MLIITEEKRAHAAQIEAMLDAGFGADRRRKRSYDYRAGVPRLAPLCLVALLDGTLAGSIRFWPIVIGESRTPALLLGPLVVHPDHRKSGIGSRLMREGLARAKALGHRVVLLVGDQGYYERFGFALAAPHGIEMPGESPLRLMAMPLVEGGLEGVSGAVQSWRSLRGGRLARAA
jgi:predicted N-acetyltransferase YhbS